MYRRRAQGAFTQSMADMRSLWDKKLFDNLPIVRQLRSSKEEMEQARSGKLGGGLTHWSKLHTVVAATSAFRSADKYKMHSASHSLAAPFAAATRTSTHTHANARPHACASETHLCPHLVRVSSCLERRSQPPRPRREGYSYAIVDAWPGAKSHGREEHHQHGSIRSHTRGAQSAQFHRPRGTEGQHCADRCTDLPRACSTIAHGLCWAGPTARLLAQCHRWPADARVIPRVISRGRRPPEGSTITALICLHAHRWRRVAKRAELAHAAPAAATGRWARTTLAAKRRFGTPASSVSATPALSRARRNQRVRARNTASHRARRPR